MRPLLAEITPRTLAVSREPPTFANVAEGPQRRPGRAARGVRLAAPPERPGVEDAWPDAWPGGKEQSQLLSSDSDDSISLEARLGPPPGGDLWARIGDLRARLREVCDGNAWQGTVILAIVLNTVSMAIECDTHKWPGWRPINHSFLGFFVFELAVRLFAFGAEFFTDPNEMKGNLFDFCLVLLGVGDMWIRPLLLPDSKKGANKALAVVRQFRILRVFRSVRLIKQVPELRRLVAGFADAMQAAGWLLALFLMMIFFFGLILTIYIGHSADLWEDKHEERELIEEYFGTLARTMFTMFRYVTLDDWSAISSLVMRNFPFMSVFFCIYEFFMAFTVLALLTGVIAENYQESGRTQDEEDCKTKFDEFLRNLEPVFRESKASALCPEQASRSPLLDIGADVTDVRQASTALARGSEAGDTRLRVLSLDGFSEAQVPPQMVKIAGGGIEEFRTIEALRPRSSDDEYPEMVVDPPLDQDYMRKSRVEAVHPLVSAVISQGPPGCTDSEAIEILHCFDMDRDNILSFKDDFSRGMQLWHGDRKPKKMDLQFLHTDMRRISDLLGFPVVLPSHCPVQQRQRSARTVAPKANPRYEAWKRREAQLEKRLHKIEDLLATIIRATAPCGVVAFRPPLLAGL